MGNCLITRRGGTSGGGGGGGGVSWASGSDAEIMAAVAQADAGLISLHHDYGWNVGDRRLVTIGALPQIMSNDAFTTQSQTIELVLLDATGYYLSEPIGSKTKCSFIVGMVNALVDDNNNVATMNANYAGNNANSIWNLSPGRTWCNEAFRNAIPSTLRSIFKKFKCYYNDTNAQQTLYTDDYFAFYQGTEVFGTVQDGMGFPSSNDLLDYERNNSHKFSYFETNTLAGTDAQYCTRSYYPTNDNRSINLITTPARLYGWWYPTSARICVFGVI